MKPKQFLLLSIYCGAFFSTSFATFFPLLWNLIAPILDLTNFPTIFSFPPDKRILELFFASFTGAPLFVNMMIHKDEPIKIIIKESIFYFFLYLIGIILVFIILE